MLMQFLRCHTCLPAMTSGVIWSECVSRGKLPVAVNGQRDEDQGGRRRWTREKGARLSLGHGAPGLDADLAVVA